MRTCVKKTFVFHAAHFDNVAGPDNQCSRMHGHTYKLEIEARGKVDIPTGMVIHGDHLKEAYRTAIEPFVEHQFLNETLPILNPTMENVVAWCAFELKKVLGDLLYRVTLWETPTMSATVQAGDDLR